MPQKYSRSVQKRFSRKVLLLLGVLLVVIVFSGLELTGYTHIFRKANTSPVIPSTNLTPTKISSKGKSATPSSGSSQSGTTINNSQKSSTPASTGTAYLIAPSGIFVSNHNPGKNGAPTTEQSVCNTTPGATCFIQFTQGNVVKLLAPQVTDSNGATYWSWDAGASSIGLTPGSWNVSAIASLGGQTKTSDDGTLLEIQ